MAYHRSAHLAGEDQRRGSVQHHPAQTQILFTREAECACFHSGETQVNHLREILIRSSANCLGGDMRGWNS